MRMDDRRIPVRGAPLDLLGVVLVGIFRERIWFSSRAPASPAMLDLKFAAILLKCGGTSFFSRGGFVGY